MKACLGEHLRRAVDGGDRSHPRVRELDRHILKRRIAAPDDINIEDLLAAIECEALEKHYAQDVAGFNNSISPYPSPEVMLQPGQSRLSSPPASASKQSLPSLRDLQGWELHADLPEKRTTPLDARQEAAKKKAKKASVVDQNELRAQQVAIWKASESAATCMGEAHKNLTAAMTLSDKATTTSVDADESELRASSLMGKFGKDAMANTNLLDILEAGAKLVAKLEDLYSSRLWTTFEEDPPDVFDRKVMLMVKTRMEETTQNTVTPMTWDDKLGSPVPIVDGEMTALGIFLKTQSIKTVHTLFCVISDMKPTMVSLEGEADKESGTDAERLLGKMPKPSVLNSLSQPVLYQNQINKLVAILTTRVGMFVTSREVNGGDDQVDFAFNHLETHGLGIYMKTKGYSMVRAKAPFTTGWMVENGGTMQKAFLLPPKGFLNAQMLAQRLQAAGLPNALVLLDPLKDPREGSSNPEKDKPLTYMRWLMASCADAGRCDLIDGRTKGNVLEMAKHLHLMGTDKAALRLDADNSREKEKLNTLMEDDAAMLGQLHDHLWNLQIEVARLQGKDCIKSPAPDNAEDTGTTAGSSDAHAATPQTSYQLTPTTNLLHVIPEKAD